MDHKGVGRGGGKIMDKVLVQLDLTAEQKDQIQEQKKEHKEQIKEVREEMKGQKEELKDLINAQNTDRGQIDRVISEMGDTSKKMIRLRVDGVLGLKAILTAEQFEKFQDLMEETREKHKKMKGKKKGAGGRKGSGKRD